MSRRTDGIKIARRAAIGALRDEQENICALCHEVFTKDDPPTVDHIVPQGCGGADIRENLQLAHSRCNERRGKKSMDRVRDLNVLIGTGWLRKQHLPRKIREIIKGEGPARLRS